MYNIIASITVHRLRSHSNQVQNMECKAKFLRYYPGAITTICC